MQPLQRSRVAVQPPSPPRQPVLRKTISFWPPDLPSRNIRSSNFRQCADRQPLPVPREIKYIGLSRSAQTTVLGYYARDTQSASSFSRVIFITLGLVLHCLVRLSTTVPIVPIHRHTSEEESSKHGTKRRAK